MNKPKERTKAYWEYFECEKYIADKLGVVSLDDFAGKFKHPGDSPEYKTTPYLDFWHYLTDHCGIHNGCHFWMPEPNETDEKMKWVNPILEAFWEEFGEGPYWVSW